MTTASTLPNFAAGLLRPFRFAINSHKNATAHAPDFDGEKRNAYLILAPSN
jgi:hypothetical protein